MNADIKKRWVEALRSGEYKQGFTVLHEGNGGFCCLGVLCDIHAKETGEPWIQPRSIGEYTYLGNPVYLPRDVQSWAGLEDDSPVVPFKEGITSLDVLNDYHRYSFDAIADLIEENL